MMDAARIDIIVENKIHMEGALPRAVEEALIRRLEFANPAYIEKAERGYWTENVPEMISLIDYDGGSLVIPRGFMDNLMKILDHHRLTYMITEETRRLPEVAFQFIGQLHDSQQEAVEAALATAQLIGKGFDCPAWTNIFLATSIKFTGRVIQSVGRILRISQGKTAATIYDFVDRPGVLKASFFIRRKAYRQQGVEDV